MDEAKLQELQEIQEIQGLQALSEIILPAGSTSTDLQAAIDNAALGDVIIISGDMPFNGAAVIIAQDKEITIQSDTGNNWTISAPAANMRHFDITGSLTLQNITLYGANISGGINLSGGKLTMNDGAVIQNCRSNSSGGGIKINSAALTMNDGSAVQNCHSTASGGGAYANPSGTIIINGGVINGNTSGGAGGGVMLQESTLTMTAGGFSGNTASASGGAIQTLGSNTVNISGGIISGNTAGFQGGGIGLAVGTISNISDAVIRGNTAKSNGGGIFVQGEVIILDSTISGNASGTRGGGIYSYAYGKMEIRGESYIINNNAPDGGGIYTVNNTYSNLVTGSETVFSCNWASKAYQPPADAGTLYPDIQFADTSITDHPLNNFDINYSTGEPIDIFINVTYDANGGSGSHTGPDIVPGGTDTVLTQTETGISRDGYTVVSWNTEPDGSGISYSPGETITLGCDLMLFAQWDIAPEFYNITYDANGGSGSHTGPDIVPGGTDTVLSQTETGISYGEYIFVNWNTRQDGSGTSYLPGETITLNDDLTLFAQWDIAPEFYNITYDANGGSGGHTGPDIVPGGTDTVLSQAETGISYGEYIFVNWNTRQDGSGTSYSPGETITLNNDLTLFAQWADSPKIYTITYDCNGGSGGYIDHCMEFDADYTILSTSQTGISRTGSVFTVWNTRQDGSGTSYSPGETITLNDDLTLFAQWADSPKIYTITYKCNGGNGGYVDRYMEFDVDYTVLSTSQTGISRAGSVFTVWNTRQDGSGISYAYGAVITIYGDVVLYAQWMQLPVQQRRCRAAVMKCRTSIEGQKLWADDNNSGNTRPTSVEILLLRDGEVYRRANIDSAGDGHFGFCCVPIWKNTNQKYIYRIDETAVPGYIKTISGYTVINTLTAP